MPSFVLRDVGGSSATEPPRGEAAVEAGPEGESKQPKATAPAEGIEQRAEPAKGWEVMQLNENFGSAGISIEVHPICYSCFESSHEWKEEWNWLRRQQA
eukprot:scaffold103469_cov33-Prasinocladus_malaysianus.AAC.2